MNLEQFIKGAKFPFARIICSDGFSMSVQGGEGLYSHPRAKSESYSAMEIGFPSKRELLILDYAEDEYRPEDTVYPYTPVSIIQEVIDKHGGIDVDKTFDR